MNDPRVAAALMSDGVVWNNNKDAPCWGGAGCFASRKKNWWPCRCGYEPRDKGTHPTIGGNWQDPWGTCPACHLRRDPSCSGPVCKQLKTAILTVPGQRILAVPAAGCPSSQSTWRPTDLPAASASAGHPKYVDVAVKSENFEDQRNNMRHELEKAALRATIASMQKTIGTSTQRASDAEEKAARTMDDQRTRIQQEKAELRNMIASMQEKIDTLTQHVETTRTRADELKEIASGSRSSSGSDSDTFQLVLTSQQEIQETHKEMLGRIKALEDAAAAPRSPGSRA